MYFKLLLLVTSFFSGLFLWLIFRTFKGQSLKVLWQNAKFHVQYKNEIKKNIKKSEENGEKPFHFDITGRINTEENADITIYAKTQVGALGKYKAIQEQIRKNHKRQIKKNLSNGKS